MWNNGEGNVSFAPVAAPIRNHVQHKISLIDLLDTQNSDLKQGQVTSLSVRRFNPSTRQHTDWFRQWMKKESSGSYWQDLVNVLLPWWPFMKSLQGFRAIISRAAENTHGRDEETQSYAMPSASFVTEEMLQGGDWKKMNAPWRSAGLSACLWQTWQPARERYKLCGNRYGCYGMSSPSSTSRFRLEVKEYRDMSRRKEWTLRCEIEVMWLSVQLEMGQ